MQAYKRLLGAGLGVMLAGLATSAMAQSEIKIGEINSYSLLPAFTDPGTNRIRQVRLAPKIRESITRRFRTSAAILMSTMTSTSYRGQQPELQYLPNIKY